MKYYMASYNGSVTEEGMDYKEHGSKKDLFMLFPELQAIINRLPLRTIEACKLRSSTRVVYASLQAYIVTIVTDYQEQYGLADYTAAN